MRAISCDGGAGFVPLGGADPAPAPFRRLGEPDTPAPEGPAPAPAPAAADPVAGAFAAGREAGLAEARVATDALAREVADAVAAVVAFREHVRTRYADEVLALALDVARKILGEALDARPERWLEVIHAGVKDLVDRERVLVRVPPRLAATLRETAGALWAACADAKEVVLVDDPSLGERGCVVEGRAGDVDVGIESQLAAVADALGLGAR